MLEFAKETITRLKMLEAEIVTPLSLLDEPGRVDEPRVSQEFSDVLTKVAAERRPIIVCRAGADLAAVVPLEHLELLREMLARQETERRAARIDWDPLVKAHPVSPEWLNDNDNPFEAEEDPAP